MARTWARQPSSCSSRCYWPDRGASHPRRPRCALPLRQLIEGAAVAAASALLAAAFALLWPLLGRLHLAMGELAALGAVVALVASVGLGEVAGLPLALALPYAALAAPVVAGLAGGLTGSRGTARLWASLGLAPLVASPGLALVLREGLRLAAGARARRLPPLLGEPVLVLDIEGFRGWRAAGRR